MSVDLERAERELLSSSPGEGASDAPPGVPEPAYYDVNGRPRTASGKMLSGPTRKDLASPPKNPPRDRSKKATASKKTQAVETRVPSQVAPAPRPSPSTSGGGDPSRAEAEEKLRDRWGDFWDMVAEAWDDDTLRVSETEKRQWAKPVASTLEQMGWLHHTAKLDPIGAVAVTVKQAAPRVKKMALAPSPRLRGPNGKPPPFRRPPGAQAPVGMPPMPEPANGMPPTDAGSGAVPLDPRDQLFNAANAGKPLPIDERFTGTPDSFDY